jgi:hypothetical protein
MRRQSCGVPNYCIRLLLFFFLLLLGFLLGIHLLLILYLGNKDGERKKSQTPHGRNLSRVAFLGGGQGGLIENANNKTWAL